MLCQNVLEVDSIDTGIMLLNFGIIISLIYRSNAFIKLHLLNVQHAALCHSGNQARISDAMHIYIF